ncbi:MAG: hypothetical protein ACFFEY_01570 [Candidatus Thorarchaeota archaeon]
MKLSSKDCKYEQNVEDKSLEKCPRYGSHNIKIFLFGVAAKNIGRSRVYRRDQEKYIFKKCKKDIVPIREEYSPKHTLGWLPGDPRMTRGLRCPNFNKKLYSKVEDIILKSSCIITTIIISVHLIITFI